MRRRIEPDPAGADSRPWILAKVDGSMIAPHLTLLPDGRIGGSTHRSEIRWNLDGSCLRFLDEFGRTSASFCLAEADFGEPAYGLVGSSRPHGAVVLRPLDTQSRPSLPTRGAGNQRRNLIVLRAGPDSLHPFWTRDIDANDRNWDLLLSWYGDPRARPDGCDHFFAEQGTKFEGLASLLGSETVPWGYDHVWMPDDDLMAGWADINLMFALCAEYDLMLAQPSLAMDSFINHPITQRDPRMLMRFTSFVEIMAPVFSHAALRRCAPTFSESRSGYGLDHVWPRLIGAPPNKIAIIDAMSVSHTRPVGATYEMAGAIAEGNAIEDAYRVFRRYQVFGFVPAEPQGVVRLRDKTSGGPIFLSGDAARQACA